MVEFSLSLDAVRGALAYFRRGSHRADPLSRTQLEGALERERTHTLHVDMQSHMQPDSAQKTQSATQ